MLDQMGSKLTDATAPLDWQAPLGSDAKPTLKLAPIRGGFVGGHA